MRGIFITGTDTGVGKTVASAALMLRYPETRYWKPIQTGIEIDDDTTEVRRLTGCSDHALSNVRLRLPVSPHLAARHAGVRIDLEALTEWTTDSDVPWIVEGAGGVLVPLNENQTIATLMLRLGLPVLVVARTALGTINHTLLTIEALRSRALHVAGVVMIGDPNPDNCAAIEHYGKVAVLGEMPRFHPLRPSQLAEWACAHLDRENRLAEFFE